MSCSEQKAMFASQNQWIRTLLAADTQVSARAAALVFAHPDDEVIALGARLARYRSAVIVHVTDGAPRNGEESRKHGFSSIAEYRACRKSELDLALKRAGLGENERVCLNFPDQEASLHLGELGRRLHQILGARTPALIFTHPYEGGHPDHDACAFAVQLAVARMQSSGQKPPVVMEAPFYHASARGMETGCFLPPPEPTPEVCLPLSHHEQREKRELFACFASQQEMLRNFRTDTERFRVAPRYDFHQPPHPGPVFYDQYPWGMTSRRFCELARAADALEETLR